MNDLQRLNEMGISVWDIRDPSLFEQSPKPFLLPETCQLLFVCNETPNEQQAWLFGKILGSMQLLPSQALQIPSVALSSLNAHSLQWCWFCDCQNQEMIEGVKNIFSPSLSTLSEDINAKKTFWNQIKQASK